MDEVRALLRIERRVPLSKPDNFSVSTAEQMVEQFRGVVSMIAIAIVHLNCHKYIDWMKRERKR